VHPVVAAVTAPLVEWQLVAQAALAITAALVIQRVIVRQAAAVVLVQRAITDLAQQVVLVVQGWPTHSLDRQ
jgi:hypothetical protein